MIQPGTGVTITAPHPDVPMGASGLVLRRVSTGYQVRFDLPNRSVTLLVPDHDLAPIRPWAPQGNPMSPTVAVLLAVGGVAVVGAVATGIYLATRRTEPPPVAPGVPSPTSLGTWPDAEELDSGLDDEAEADADDDVGLGAGTEDDSEAQDETPPPTVWDGDTKTAATWRRFGFPLQRAAAREATRIGRRYKGLEGSINYGSGSQTLLYMGPGSGSGSGGGGGALLNPNMATGPSIWSEDEALAVAALAWNSTMPRQWLSPWGTEVEFGKFAADGDRVSIPGVLSWAQRQAVADGGLGSVQLRTFGRLVGSVMNMLGAEDEVRPSIVAGGASGSWNWRERFGA